MTDEIKKTSNPIFTEGKDLQGNMPTRPRTESMFDHDHTKDKPVTHDVHGQKHTGKAAVIPNRITTPNSTAEAPINTHIYFDAPGDYPSR